MDMFDELVEIEVGIIVPYVKSLVELCLQVYDHFLTTRIFFFVRNG